MIQILKARTIVSLASGRGHLRRRVSTNSSTVEKSKEIKNLKPWKEIPGPPSLPLLGVIHNFFPGGKLAGYKGGKMTDQLYQHYGPIVKFDANLGAKRKVFLFDPQEVENVMRNEEPMPVRPILESLEYYRKRHNKRYDPDRATGLGTDHGKLWRKYRTILNPILMQPKTIQLYAGAMEAVADDLVARFRSVRDVNNKIKRLDVEMNRWSLESVAVVALGTRLHCFDPGLAEDAPVSQLIRNMNAFFSVVEKLDVSPSAWKIYSTPAFKKAMRINEEIERVNVPVVDASLKNEESSDELMSLIKYFIDQGVENCEGLKKDSAETSSTEKSVLEKLLEIDAQLAVVTAGEMLLAGVVTTANTVLAALYLLAKNPEKQSKLREEILSKQDQKRYLKACISESLRMLPPAIGTVRLTTKEHHILGYKVPTDVQIMFCAQTMSHMEEYFPRAEQFIPERWLAGKDDPRGHGNAQLFATLPFGFGVRSCIGLRIAQLEIETIISKLLENFQLERPSEEPIHIEPGLTNQVKEPVHITFTDL